MIKHRKSLWSGNTTCTGSDSARSGPRQGISSICVRTYDRAVPRCPKAAIAAGLGVPPPPAHGVTYCFPQPQWAQRRPSGPARQSTRNLSKGRVLLSWQFLRPGQDDIIYTLNTCYFLMREEKGITFSFSKSVIGNWPEPVNIKWKNLPALYQISEQALQISFSKGHVLQVRGDQSPFEFLILQVLMEIRMNWFVQKQHCQALGPDGICSLIMKIFRMVVTGSLVICSSML